VDDGVPTLGICLGAQLLGVAAGGRVVRGEAGPELGLGRVDVTETDELLTAGPMSVVQWHFDTVVDLPADVAVLASSDRYAVQAFRVGEVAWGVQFHVEATLPMVADWARADAAAVRSTYTREPEDLVADVAAAEETLVADGEALARRFAKLVTG
jgi:GMP synthase-like glutamine amidotransferase